MLKKLLFSVLSIFTISLIAGDRYCDPLMPSINVTFADKVSHAVFPHSVYSRGVQAPAWSDHNQKNNNYYACLTEADFHRMFVGAQNEKEILSNYDLYAYPNFRTYARTLSTYNEFITSLAAKIKTDKQFRKKTACVPGFEYSFGLRSEKSGFHDFINDEVHRIGQLCSKQKIATKQGSLHINAQVLNQIAQEWSAKSKIVADNTRITDRLNALHITRNHKNKSANAEFSTELDYQLHKELTESRTAMNLLERNFAYAHHVQVLAPVVYDCALQAAREHSPIIAFQLSDFCHAVTQVLCHGMHVLYDTSYAVGRGVSKGVSAIATVGHWKDMATGCLHMGLLFADAVGQENALDYSIALARSSHDSDAVFKIAQQHCLHTKTQKDAMEHCLQQMYHKIQSMSWQELLEGGTEIGITMILDTLALNAVGGFTRSASGAFMQQLTKATESGAIFAEQYAVEVAGFGKLIAEEGPKTSGKITDVLKNYSNSTPKEEYVFQSMQDVLKNQSSMSGSIVAEVSSNWKAINFGIGKLEKHFNKHVLKKAEWGPLRMTIDEYLNKAKTLLNSEINGCIDGFVSKDGWVFRYNKATNEFATAKPDGIIETLFRPEGGIVYWIDQIKKYR